MNDQPTAGRIEAGASDLWRCPVCRATHEQPQARCRRCEADLLAFVRLELAAREAELAHDHQLARVLRGPRS